MSSNAPKIQDQEVSTSKRKFVEVIDLTLDKNDDFPFGKALKTILAPTTGTSPVIASPFNIAEIVKTAESNSPAARRAPKPPSKSIANEITSMEAAKNPCSVRASVQTRAAKHPVSYANSMPLMQPAALSSHKPANVKPVTENNRDYHSPHFAVLLTYQYLSYKASQLGGLFASEVEEFQRQADQQLSKSASNHEYTRFIAENALAAAEALENLETRAENDQEELILVRRELYDTLMHYLEEEETVHSKPLIPISVSFEGKPAVRPLSNTSLLSGNFKQTIAEHAPVRRKSVDIVQTAQVTPDQQSSVDKIQASSAGTMSASSAVKLVTQEHKPTTSSPLVYPTINAADTRIPVPKIASDDLFDAPFKSKATFAGKHITPMAARSALPQPSRPVDSRTDSGAALLQTPKKITTPVTDRASQSHIASKLSIPQTAPDAVPGPTVTIPAAYYNHMRQQQADTSVWNSERRKVEETNRITLRNLDNQRIEQVLQAQSELAEAKSKIVSQQLEKRILADSGNRSNDKIENCRRSPHHTKSRSTTRSSASKCNNLSVMVREKCPTKQRRVCKTESRQ